MNQELGTRDWGLGIRDADAQEAPVLLRLMQAAFQEYEGVLDPPTGAHIETIDTMQRRT
jgi:hypothetical protein